MKPPSSSKQRERDFQRSQANKSTSVHSTAPGDEKKPRPDKATRRRYLKEYRKWLWPYRWGLFVILLLALITTGLDMVWPLAIRLIMDRALVGNAATQSARTGELLRLGSLIIVVLLLKQVLESMRSWRTASLD